jgi:hypothetical protein
MNAYKAASLTLRVAAEKFPLNMNGARPSWNPAPVEARPRK